MRKKELEVTARREILEMMDRCQVCRVAFRTDDYPYIVPMNFGMEEENGELSLYFHCASAGRKLELLRLDSRVGFEMDIAHRMKKGDKACKFDMYYESVIGHGIVEIVPEDDKVRALNILMRHLDGNKEFTFEAGPLSRVTALRLRVMEVTGKHNLRS